MFDALTPEIISVTPFYVSVVLVGYWFPRPKAALVLALLAAPLIVIGRWITIPDGVPHWEAWLNRGLAIGTVWLTAAFVWCVRVLEQKLQTSKDRLQFALDAVQLGSWRYDPSRRVASVDTRFKEVFDVAADELPIEDLKKLVHPDDAERFWADREAAIDPANPRPYAHEYRVRRRDGEVRWVHVRLLPQFESTGSHRWLASTVGTVQDITERKEHEERERFLVREMNHRVKNILSVVDAIAHQTTAKRPEDSVERFSERIRALAANQDLLFRNEWKGVDVEDLVRAQLSHFADLIGSRIVVDGPKLRFNTVGAQAIGLVIHELATNAGKYGALSTDAGQVNVRWGTESEGPPVSAPDRRGFGTTVTKAMVERSVGGAVELDYAPSGLSWRLSCPAANALERRRANLNAADQSK
jgi:PAS domain S-box-containing protein